MDMRTASTDRSEAKAHWDRSVTLQAWRWIALVATMPSYNISVSILCRAAFAEQKGRMQTGLYTSTRIIIDLAGTLVT